MAKGTFKGVLKSIKRFPLADTKRKKRSGADVLLDFDEPDKNKVWAFCSGHSSNDFRGNPKYLFIYMNKYRSDIVTYWLCEDIRIVRQVREMGYKAYQLGTPEAELVMEKTGVFVAEQVKTFIPRGLSHAKYLNLWHGVGGVKAVERSQTEGILAYELAKKYIDRNTYYLNNELYLAPSKFIEDIAREQLGIAPEKIIRAGYPRNIYQKNCERISSFDFDIIQERDLPEDTRMIAYVPTFRNQQKGELFASAIPDMEKLIKVCEENHLLMIFKMHPYLEKEMSFHQSKETYADCPWLCFWDNKNDFYEIMDQVDLCIMDYSSIFTDFVASGTKHFIRYIFDIDPETLDFPLGYDEATLGTKCQTFDELLEAIASYRNTDLSADIERINKLYWEYDDENSLDRIIDATMNLKIEEKEYPVLYSFDIFDTLISRVGLSPYSIFYKVKEKMEESDLGFSKYLCSNFPKIRQYCESNCREYYNRSTVERDDLRCEIQFSYIYDRMQILYDLTDAQKEQLMQWELEAELEDTIPLPEQIKYVKELLKKGETVILISDMYLPASFVKQMLAKSDPVLAELPLFLSSEYGYQKSARSLFLEVYKSFTPNYTFSKWVHHGDHPRSDVRVPESLNIKSSQIVKPVFNDLENNLVKAIGTYDAYLIAAKMARFRQTHTLSKDEFAYSYISLLFVPYVHWAVHDAIKRGDEVLYFVARDGHHLKRIADEIIRAENLSIETKYIYASRRVWRIPSFIDHIDVGFWGQGYGNFGKLSSYSKMLKALDMEEEDFRRIFPELSNVNEETNFTNSFALSLVNVFKGSAQYEEYLLNKAAEERVPVCAYLKQEIDETKQFSIVEYWGRGYTQENFTRLWQQVVGKEVPSVFYYSRSTLPSDEFNIRRNFTCNPQAQQFIEAIFANVPYRSLEEYRFENGKWEPVIKPLECDFQLYESMQAYLPLFAKDYCEIPASDKPALGRALIDFAINYYVNGQTNPLFVDNLAHLVDSVELYGNKVEYAKELTWEDMERIKHKTPRNQLTKSMPMSFARSSDDVQQAFLEKFQLRQGEDPRYGAWLSEKGVAKNQAFGQKKDVFKEESVLLKQYYEEACATQEVRNKVILLSASDKFDQLSFRRICRILERQSELEVSLVGAEAYKGEERLEAFAREIASARFIIAEKSVGKIGSLKLRNETKLIIIGDSACFFQPTGLLKPLKFREERELHLLKSQMDIAVLQTPSDKMKEIYKKIFSTNILTDFSLRGNCLTDCYFDEAFCKRTREELYTIFPEAQGKKIICYAPSNRYRSVKARYAEMFDLKQMAERLGDEYVMLVNTIKQGEHPIQNVLEVPGFAKNMTGRLAIRSQFAIADVIIGDYRDVIFESVLTDKPLFLSCADYSKTVYRKRALFPYEEFAKDITAADTEDIIQKIQTIDAYDYSTIRRFKEEYLTYCDGKSTERLVEYLLDHRL